MMTLGIWPDCARLSVGVQSFSDAHQQLLAQIDYKITQSEFFMIHNFCII